MSHGGEHWHRGLHVPKGRFHRSGRFGRKFPHLRSLKSFTLADAEKLGEFGGALDGGETPAENSKISAGFTFLGQFIDHDLTFDTTSQLEFQNDPEAIQNFRTPAFELDSVYGLGPKAQPYLYESSSTGRFLTATSGVDHQRNVNGTAIIGDPRNDENMLISQLHLAFQKFHNYVYDDLKGDFEAAQTEVRWHYQWIVLNEFLRLTCGDDAVDEALARPMVAGYADEAFMPVEFAVAAYRFGHSQVRAKYRVNRVHDHALSIFPKTADTARPADPDDRDDLRSGPVTPRFAVDWSLFFGANAQRTNKIDSKLATPLLNLPFSVVDEENGGGDGDPRRSLAVRNLQRGISFALPSGEAIADFYGIPPLTKAQVGDVPGGEDGTPLWFYVLKEAEVLAKGERLAGVGARIASEVFVDLLRMDTASFLARDPGWTPTLESKKKGHFGIEDLLALAAEAKDNA